MMQQYVNMKEEYKDAILFYRLGDFYEMFFDDAILASKELDITLTGRDCGLEERAPMCGVPFHSVDGYIARLVSKGHKVAICEQFKNENSKEVSERKVVRIITPGTVTEPGMLDEAKNSYILAINQIEKEITLCFADISTGEIYISDEYEISDPHFVNEITRFSPKEIYIKQELKNNLLIKNYVSMTNECTLSVCFNEKTDNDYIEIVYNHLKEDKLHGTNKKQIICFGFLLDYLHRTQLCDLKHLTDISLLGNRQYMELDSFTWRNLELTETMRSKEKKGSLLGLLDKTETPMGARLLRRFLEKPLTNVEDINKRLESVRTFTQNIFETGEISANLKYVKDTERLISKVVYDTITPRDIRSLIASLKVLPQIKHNLQDIKDNSSLLSFIYDEIGDHQELADHLDRAIKDTPPAITREGDFIKDGYNDRIDELRALRDNSAAVLAQMEADEKEKTGIKNLRFSYNKVFGYYIEVTNSYLNLVPDNYIRKQTLVNAERFITSELKELESKLLSAGDEIVSLELSLYEKIKELLRENTETIKRTSTAIAYLDVLVSFAEIAQKQNYCEPTVNYGNILDIKNGRHPVIESILKNEVFVPNDVYLDTYENRSALITGPNMAGKSTYMRQTALITIMAQIGSFVPASSAVIGIVDKIFTRVGASDDLASGQSTFMVEMNEVAYILDNATSKSLLIFDEIGRGTSTYDGMSIARAVLEHVTEKIKARTMFSTHYHELTRLEGELIGLKNYNIAAKKKGQDILFLRKILRGGTDDSYGIDVARLAGVSNDVIKRAEKILQTLESDSPQITKNKTVDDFQLALQPLENDEIIEELKKTDVTVLTPLEAMNVLYRLSEKAKNAEIK
ncbi:MAG: DNA mismatch repair protein MutS [Ruminococcaceae bacterium]|nr:DNA mismatch repair protein MutS [Oscillospiraceae bacterium]